MNFYELPFALTAGGTDFAPGDGKVAGSGNADAGNGDDMTSPFDGTAFIFLWVGFLLLMSSGVVIFFLWGIRTRQFSDQDRARYLALQARIPTPEEMENEHKAGRGRRQP